MGNLGSLVVSLEANITKFEQGISKAEYLAKKGSDNIVSAVKLIGGAFAGLVSVGKLESMFKEITTMESNLLKVAGRLNTNVETLSSFGIMARKTGMDSEAFISTLTRMDKGLSAAARGAETATGKFDEEGEEILKTSKTYDELGIKAQELIKLPLDQRLLAIAEAFQKNIAPGDQVRVAMELGGKSAAGMVNVFREGPAAMEKWIARQQELGIITTDMAKRGAEAKAAASDLSSAWSNFSRELVDSVAPAIAMVTNALTEMIITSRKAPPAIAIAAETAMDWAQRQAESGGKPRGVTGSWIPDDLFKSPVKPGAAGKGGGKGARAMTEVTPFEQSLWAMEDAEKLAKEIDEALTKMLDNQERLVKGQQSYASEMAGLSPLLADQLRFKGEALQLEHDLAIMTLKRELEEKKITPAIHDQEVGYRALLTQAKKVSLERDSWATQGIGGGMKLFAMDLRQDSATALAFGIRDGFKGAKGFADDAITKMLMSPFTKEKMSFKKIGLDIATQITGGLVKMGTTRLFSVFTEGALGMVSTWQTAQQAMTAASFAGDAARIASMSSGATQGIGILSALAKAQILVEAGQSGAAAFRSVMQVVPFPFNAVLAPIAAAAAFAATMAFGSGFGGGQSGIARQSNATNMQAAVPFAAGGIITRPTFALMGEAGPEAVIPLRGGRVPVEGGGGSPTVITVNAPITIYPRQEMTQRDYDRHIGMIKKSLNRAAERHGIKIMPGR